MLNGNGGSIRSRANLIPEFAARYQVIALDARCHGKSDCPPGYLTYEQMASDVNAVLDYLGIDSAYLWGHSDGGIVGLLMAIHYPKKVKKLLASGPNLRPDTTAVDPALLPLLDKMWAVVKSDSIKSKQFRLLVDQPHISTSDLAKIKADVLIWAVTGMRFAVSICWRFKRIYLVPCSAFCPGQRILCMPIARSGL